MSSVTSPLKASNESFLLDDILDQKSLRENSLARAAQITPLVTSITLGPNSTFHADHSEEVEPKIAVSTNKENVKSPRNVSYSKSPITSSDLKGMQYKMYKQVEEKKLNEQIRKQMEARVKLENEHYEKIQRMLETMKVEAEMKHKAKVEALERQIETALKLEEEDEMEYQKHRVELTKNTRKILEKQEKDLRESLQRVDNDFNKLGDGFNKIALSCNPEMSAVMEFYKKQFDELRAHRSAKGSSMDGLRSLCVKAEELCRGLLKASKDFEAEAVARRIQKEAEEQQAAAQAQAQAQAQAAQQAQQLQQAEILKQVAVVAPVGAQSGTARHFNDLMRFLMAKQNATRQLAETTEFEGRRFALKLAINGPINLLNEANRTTLIEGFQKLHDLLAGQRITTTKGTVAISDHPEASDWVKLRLAEKLIDICDKKQELMFFTAALTVALWQKFPDFGRIFLAKLFKECPFLVPHKPPTVSGQSDEDFLTSYGYRRNEKYEHYQSRTQKFAALMAAIWTTSSRRDEQAPHPFPIDHGWKYLANVLNSPADPMVLHLVDKILEISGSAMHQTFGRQFEKLMFVLREQYMPVVGNSVDEKMKAAFDRLRETIAKFCKENRFATPKAKLNANYW